MIKVKITKNVINKSVSPLGSAMTPRLIVMHCTWLSCCYCNILCVKRQYRVQCTYVDSLCRNSTICFFRNTDKRSRCIKSFVRQTERYTTI